MWNDAQTTHPPFIWDEAALLRAEWLYLGEAGQAAGAAGHLPPARRTDLAADALTADAAASLELEGVSAARPEMERCVRTRLGLAGGQEPGNECGDPLKRGVADVIARIPQLRDAPVTVKSIEDLGVLLGGADNIDRPGSPSAGASPGVLAREREQDLRALRRELEAFVAWHSSIDRADSVVSPLIHAGLAHLWFETIHPYRFGSGIAGRALAEKALMWRHPGMPFIPVSPVLLRYKNEYLACLDKACSDRDATEWVLWFAAAAVEAVRRHKAAIRFRLEREEFLEKFRDRVSRREKEILLHMFGLGVEECPAGMCVKRYSRHSGLPTATVAADMAKLAECGALVRKARGNTARYHLNIPSTEVERVAAEEIT